MLQLFRLARDARIATLMDDRSVLFAMTSSHRKLVLEMPPPLAAQLHQDTHGLLPGAVPQRPAPPRYKWDALLSRLDANRLTDADRLAVRDLLFHLGIRG